jgi:hypothetical protein
MEVAHESLYLGICGYESITVIGYKEGYKYIYVNVSAKQ